MLTLLCVDPEPFAAEPMYAAGLTLVPAHIHPNIIRYVHARDRAARLAVRLVLRWWLCRNNMEQTLVSLRTTRAGKPILADQGLSFSFTHTEGFAAVAISTTCSVGVDAETTPPLALENFHSILCAAEIQSMTMAPTSEQRHDLLLQSWCLREAVLKAHGSGLVHPEHTLQRMGETMRTQDGLHTMYFAGQCWYARSFTLLRPGLGMIAADSLFPPIRPIFLLPDQLLTSKDTAS